ncbi:MAG: hypothetical protein DRJ67_06140 [Thermoprotei archaeon]|nr:MAG: hypothetical protein DRJ67_06140 [Thermoprotei archaeon]
MARAFTRTHVNTYVLVVEANGALRSVAVFSRGGFKLLKELVALINNMILGEEPYEVERLSELDPRSRLLISVMMQH